MGKWGLKDPDGCWVWQARRLEGAYMPGLAGYVYVASSERLNTLKVGMSTGGRTAKRHGGYVAEGWEIHEWKKLPDGQYHAEGVEEYVLHHLRKRYPQYEHGYLKNNDHMPFDSGCTETFSLSEVEPAEALLLLEEGTRMVRLDFWEIPRTR